MERARRHQRLLSVLAFGLLAVAAELLGRSLTHRFDFGRHVAAPSYSGADYYPILLVVVKCGIALLVGRLAWRLVRARLAERSGLRLGGGGAARPRLRLAISGRRSLAFFVLTTVIYLVQADAEGAAAGRWPLLAPWLHSSALPVFAVLSVLCAVGVGSRTALARRLRGVRAGDRRPCAPACRPPNAPHAAAARRRRRSRLAASSGWRSRAARLPCLRNPRHSRGTVFSTRRREATQ